MLNISMFNVLTPAVPLNRKLYVTLCNNKPHSPEHLLNRIESFDSNEKKIGRFEIAERRRAILNN